MQNCTSSYIGMDAYRRRDEARRQLDSDPSLFHIVVGYGDLNNRSFETNPAYLVFDNEAEWDAWVSMYQPNGYIDALHKQ